MKIEHRNYAELEECKLWVSLGQIKAREQHETDEFHAKKFGAWA